MAGTYNITIDPTATATTLKLSFGAPAQNDAIVRDAVEAVRTLDLKGGEVVRLNGPASLPVACALAHELGHLYGAVACFDPKLAKYVVAVAHGGKYNIGDLIE